MTPVREPLPIDDALPAVLAAFRRATAVLLMAPPGSGKTTRVPPALLDVLGERGGQVVVLEPRRLAARAAAARVAQETGTALGDLVGYQVRGDSKVSGRTRVRFVTEGVLVRQLVQDPFLEGVGAIERGELRSDVDVRRSIASIVGSFLFARFMSSDGFDRSYADAVLDDFVRVNTPR